MEALSNRGLLMFALSTFAQALLHCKVKYGNKDVVTSSPSSNNPLMQFHGPKKVKHLKMSPLRCIGNEVHPLVDVYYIDFPAEGSQTAWQSGMYDDDLASYDRILDRFVASIERNGGVVGMDCEWRPERSRKDKKKDTGAQYLFAEEWVYSKTAVLQLATTSMCLVIGILHLSALPDKIYSILCNEHILKVGFDVSNDAIRIYRDFSCKVNKVVDLKVLFCKCKPDFINSNTASLSMTAVTQHTLKCDLYKTKDLQCSDWADENGLSEEQLLYAAKDALACIETVLQLHIDLPPSKNYNDSVIFAQWLSIYAYTIEYEGYKKKSKNKPTIDNAKYISSECSTPSSFSFSTSKNSTRKPKTHKVETRKTDLYDNCRIMAKDGQVLSTCSFKKLQWYVDKGLADMEMTVGQDGEEYPGIRLKFEPKGRDQCDDEYYLSSKSNTCVVCSANRELLRHCIVPIQYKQFFPTFMKAHLSHDVVLLCIPCHRKMLAFDVEYSHRLANRYQCPTHDAKNKYSFNGQAKKVRRACTALSGRNAATIPLSVRREFAALINSHFEATPPSATSLEEEVLVAKDVLQKGLALVDMKQNEEWKSHGELVVQGVISEYLVSNSSTTTAPSLPFTKTYSSPSVVCCRNGHRLRLISRDNGWHCDTSQEKEKGGGGCKCNNVTTGQPRWRCNLCDFDYCGLCYDSKLEINSKVQFISQPTPFGTFSGCVLASGEKEALKTDKSYSDSNSAKPAQSISDSDGNADIDRDNTGSKTGTGIGVSPSILGADDLVLLHALGGFVKEWRQRFLDCMKPQNLPRSWSVESRVFNSSVADIVNVEGDDDDDAATAEVIESYKKRGVCSFNLIPAKSSQ